MSTVSFSIFPNDNFIDLCLYQYGKEQCDPGHSFGPATRNHYLFHYVLSGTGTLMADNSKGITQTYSVKSGQGFLIFPGQITTYFADQEHPWEYVWLEFDGLKVKEAFQTTSLSLEHPVYRANSKELREILKNEMLYIVEHRMASKFHLIGHLYLFLDALTQSTHSNELTSSSKMSDYYIKEAIHYIEQNFQNDISIEEIAIGKSPQEFLMNYRMIKATELLSLTSLSISEVSQAVGYDNPLHFSRAFKNVYGISPRTWRKENK